MITLLAKSDKTAPQTTVPIQTAIDDAIEFIERNLKQKITVAGVANAVGVSVSSLESKFVSITGKSVYDYVIGARLRLSLQLLTTTALTVTAISEKCGYDNVFYFCNTFKKAFGLTPTQFRIQN